MENKSVNVTLITLNPLYIWIYVLYLSDIKLRKVHFNLARKYLILLVAINQEFRPTFQFRSHFNLILFWLWTSDPLLLWLLHLRIIKHATSIFKCNLEFFSKTECTLSPEIISLLGLISCYVYLIVPIKNFISSHVNRWKNLRTYVY